MSILSVAARCTRGRCAGEAGARGGLRGGARPRGHGADGAAAGHVCAARPPDPTATGNRRSEYYPLKYTTNYGNLKHFENRCRRHLFPGLQCVHLVCGTRALAGVLIYFIIYRESILLKYLHLTPDPKWSSGYEAGFVLLTTLVGWSRRALALAVTTQVSRYCNSSFHILAVKYGCTSTFQSVLDTLRCI